MTVVKSHSSPPAGLVDPEEVDASGKEGAQKLTPNSSEDTFIVDRLFALHVSRLSQNQSTANTLRDLPVFIAKVKDPLKRAAYEQRLVEYLLKR